MLDESECANFLDGKVVVGTLTLGQLSTAFGVNGRQSDPISAQPVR